MGRDGPPSGRRGYGFRQAVEAGAPFTGPRSTSRINLDQLLVRRPALRDQANSLLAAGHRADAVLDQLREAGLDGRLCVAIWRDAEEANWVKTEYGDDEEKFVAEVAWGFGLGIYGAATLWEMDEAGVWAVLRTWPAGVD